MQIYFYWNKEYAEKLLRHNSSVPAFDISGKSFSAAEIKSLRKYEVVMLPKDDEEFCSMREFAKSTFNPFGVVHITKYPMKEVV